MIQDIEPKKMHNEYRKRTPMENDRVMCFFENHILCRIEENRLSYPTYENLKGLELKKSLIYLFSIDETAYYYYQTKERISLEGYAYEKMFRLRSTIPLEEMFAGVSAYHLHCWYEDNRYCGHCGEKLSLDDKERMLRCEHCHHTIYPRINPAVIVAVCHGDEILFTKYLDREYKRYALIAGFAEFGETIEETVKREVLEEVGIEVTNIRYYGSQPWGFSGSLLLGFFADAVGDLTIHRQEDELSEAFWIKREDIELNPEEISLTREMMKVFKEKGNVE